MRRNQAQAAVTGGVAVAWSVCALAGAPVPVLTVLGIALLGCPGFVWCEVLLGSGTGGLERGAVAAGLAFALPILGGLALQAAGVPLGRPGWAALLVIATLVGDVLLLVRREPPPAAPRGSRSGRPGMSPGHTVIFGIAAFIALGAVGIAWEGTRLQHTPGFTQLWLAPVRARPALANLGVSNHEGRATRYLLIVQRPGGRRSVWNLALADGQAWQRSITVKPGPPVSAFLYRLPDLTHPFRQVTDNVQAPAP